MQLIRSNRPEMNVSSSRLNSLRPNPFQGWRHWPALFDWGSLWNDISDADRLLCDLFEDEEAYHVRVAMPGIKKKDVHVELENSVLTVGFKCPGKEQDNGGRCQACSRSVAVPEGIVPDEVSAKLEDGILLVRLPKSEANKARKISVK